MLGKKKELKYRNVPSIHEKNIVLYMKYPLYGTNVIKQMDIFLI